MTLIPKIEYVKDPKHVSFCHQLVCVICGNPEVHFHHLMRGKTRRGQYKAADNEGIPLCACHHNLGPESLHEVIKHGIDELEYMKMNGVPNPYGLASDLYASTGDYAECMALIEQHRAP